MEERNEPLATEIYSDLKAQIRFKDKLIFVLIAIIVTLIITLAGALVAMDLYHNWRWSQFEAVVVDSESGPATYVQGENTGGVNIGASGSTPAEGRTGEGYSGQN